MKKTVFCSDAQKICRQAVGDKQDKNLSFHVANCPECQELQKVDHWMQKFAGQTPLPQNFPAPGFLLFKARLLEKQSAAARAVLPIFWAQIMSVLIFFGGIGWLLLKSQSPVGALIKETFLSVVPLLVSGAAGAGLICAAFAYLLRRMEQLKK